MTHQGPSVLFVAAEYRADAAVEYFTVAVESVAEELSVLAVG